VNANTTSQEICSGQQVTLTGSGALTYRWNYRITNGIPFIPGSTATYTVTGTDEKRCQDTDQVSVTVNDLPVIEVYATSKEVCSGQEVILKGSGAIDYIWDNNIINGVPFIPDSTATYIVKGTDVFGCEDTASIRITVNNLPVVKAQATSTQICSGQQVSLTGTGAFAYSWDKEIIDGVAFIPSSTGTYIVTGTDEEGCQNSDQIQIFVNKVDTSVITNSNILISIADEAIYQWINCETLSEI
jgi:hypothetical protein